MGRSITVVVIIIVLFTVHSCKKNTSTAPPSVESLSIPWNLDSLPRPVIAASYLIYDVAKFNVSGLLVACKLSGDITDTSGHTNLISRGWEMARFKGAAPEYYTAGVDTVSVNATTLKDTIYGGYSHNDTVSIWNETGLNHWYISGSDSIPAFSADIPGTMPEYTGILPTTISRTHDLTITFNSSNTLNADSAYVIIGIGINISSNLVSTGGGTAIIPFSKLTACQNSNFHIAQFAASGPTYYGGYIVIVIYNHTTQTIGGKQFAFVKQREYLGIVTFL